MMKVDGFMRHEGISYVMVLESESTKINAVPANLIVGHVVKGSVLEYDKVTHYYKVIGEPPECASCGLDQLGGDNK